MSLFANLDGWSQGTPRSSTFSPPNKLRSKVNGSYGYFVFQSGGLPGPSSDSDDDKILPQSESDSEHTPQSSTPATPPISVQRQNELALALESEIAWVRSGGLLRDSLGRRDFARTDAIRAQIKLEEEEARLMDAWKSYESRWARLLNPLTSPSEVQFHDIPWPISKSDVDMELEDLSLDKIREFLFSTLKVRSQQGKLTERQIVKDSLLRWHPDKLGSIMQRVSEESMQKIKEGISAVIISLQRLKEESR